jgi:hypothetical protein
MVLVDDDPGFGSPEDAIVWPRGPKGERWASSLLPRGTYYVRVRAKHSRCETCVWTSSPKTIVLRRTNSRPQLRPARFEITTRDTSALRHTWATTFEVCDRTSGDLHVEIVEATGPAGGEESNTRTTVQMLAEPGGCRTYTVSKRSAFPFASETFVRVSIRVRDALGVWSLERRKVTWTGQA